MPAIANPRVAEHEAAAQRAMRSGQLEEAARHWQSVLSAVPDHPQALFHLGQHALLRKDLDRAKAMLSRALEANPREPAIALNLAFVFRAAGDPAGEMDALTRALTIDPYFYPALLAKGMLLERTGETRQAARTYKDVLTVSPPEDQWHPDLKAPLKHARELVESNARELDSFLETTLSNIRARYAQENLARFEACREVALGRKKVYTQQPSMLHFPALPAIQFYDDALFPWLPKLEGAADLIRDELLTVLREDMDETQPYVNHPDGAPINQWAELNHSPRWSVFFLWKDGVRDDKHCARCPRTAAVLDTIPMLQQEGYGPTAMFSILAPRTQIPPHSSVTNTRLVVHLPLIVPPGCRFRVGNETREWCYGKAWVFDDTIDHEAWNDSDQVRVILMIDIWNPFLTTAERELVTALLGGMQQYYRIPIPRP